MSDRLSKLGHAAKLINSDFEVVEMWPSVEYQIRKSGNIVFSGSEQQILSFLSGYRFALSVSQV